MVWTCTEADHVADDVRRVLDIDRSGVVGHVWYGDSV